ncbi:MAG: ChrR family anti-sigma-E factor [Phenylobacterium sp.]|uniref:ChrR family anti-sigma-E factor n=1 Tax=Phenylobacterium sp. TaxID=1871053 RepID=UPI002727F955|nr:ChrR family anti-sigma-E factor [Phenylobacterium sp.]MDO8911210.1 ChrR family anti-sigma-E factor [Phenylobacterium sp.]MDP3100753.1 ChrR family anti-sigma-E factor [Phenylobacterium sp.]
MTIETHPQASLLAAYASGGVPSAPLLAIRCHLTSCAACRAKVALMEEAEGQLLESLPPTPMSMGALDRVMDRLAAEAPEPAMYPGEMSGDVLLPPAIAEVGVAPRRWMGPGLWTAHLRLPPQDNWRAFILRAPAGQNIPQHRHVGHEFINVLQGAFSDGVRYGPGDFVESEPDSRHTQQVTSEGPCACLVVVQGQIEWRGMGRLITPMLGI